jgi:hypothetical protein
MAPIATDVSVLIGITLFFFTSYRIRYACSEMNKTIAERTAIDSFTLVPIIRFSLAC